MSRRRDLRLARAINTLSQYYGQFIARDVSRFLVSRQPNGVANDTSVSGASFPRTYTEQDELLSELINMFIDVSEGAYFIKDMVERINRILEIESSTPSEQATTLRTRFANYMAILSDVRNSPKLPTVANYAKITKSLLTSHGDVDAASANINRGQQQSTTETTPGQESSQTQSSPIYLLEAFAGRFNINPNDPNKQNPNIGLILSHTPELSIHNKFTGAVSLFLNGIPGLELSRAMPYLNVQMITARPSTRNDRLLAPSVYKFLLGAEQAPQNTVLYQLQTSNSSSNLQGFEGNYTALGMEAFLTPQTLAATNKNDLTKRSTEIFDQFNPLLSINEFTVNIQQAYAARSDRTAKLSLTLHDRGRMAEVAELFRPDLLLGNTQFLIEYGWVHPDGEINNTNNAYADIINGMRTVEKYRVTNWNFNLSDTGKVKVDLDLVIVGQTNLQTDLVVEDGINVGNTTQLISRLVERVSELRRSIFERNTESNSGGAGNNNDQSSSQQREIRGIQFLDTVNDALHNLTLNSEQLRQMNEFMTTLSNLEGIPNVSELRDTIVQLYGNSGTNNSSEGATAQLRSSIEQQINAKINTLKKDDNDPLLIPESFSTQTSQTGRVNQNAEPPVDGNVSLGNLLTNFMGMSIASSGQFDEIQLIFYPFNNCAGYASRINIANFRVDLAFFKRKYTEYVLNNLSRSGTMTIQQFWSFLISNIIDDHGARSYGLFDQQGGLWRDPNSRNRDNTENRESTGGETEHYDTPTTYSKLSCLLRNITPDGNFRMPQVSYHLETVPARSFNSDQVSEEVNNHKTILRMHVYDQATDTRGGLSQMLMSQRSSAMGMLPSIPSGGTTEGYPAITNNNQRYRENIQRALDRNLIEGVDVNNTTSLADRIRWRGGSKEIKNFLYDVMPSIIYGSIGSTIKTATVSSLQDPAATTLNIVNAPGRNGEAVDPNGEESGGLPLRVVPVEISLTSYGCPLISFASKYFVDFGTGTTLDNIYLVNGVSHKVTKGEFSTSIKMVPVDGFGTYRNYINQLRDAAQALNEIEIARTGGTPDSGAQQANTRMQEISQENCNTIATSGRPVPDSSDTNSENSGASARGRNTGSSAGAAGNGRNTGSSSDNGGYTTSPQDSILYDRTVTSDPTLVLPTPDELGKIYGPNGFEYQITPNDLLWMARSIMGEGGSIGATMWTYVNRLTAGGHGRTLSGLIQSFSQPVNPQWSRTGAFCNPESGTKRTEDRCSEANLRERDSLRARNWTSIPDHVRRLVISFAQGRIQNQWGNVVDFAASYAMTSRAYQDRIARDRVFQSGAQVYLTNDRVRNWTAQTVQIRYNGNPRPGTTTIPTMPQNPTRVQYALGGGPQPANRTADSSTGQQSTPQQTPRRSTTPNGPSPSGPSTANESSRPIIGQNPDGTPIYG